MIFIQIEIIIKNVKLKKENIFKEIIIMKLNENISEIFEDKLFSETCSAEGVIEKNMTMYYIEDQCIREIKI